MGCFLQSDIRRVVSTCDLRADGVILRRIYCVKPLRTWPLSIWPFADVCVGTHFILDFISIYFSLAISFVSLFISRLTVAVADRKIDGLTEMAFNNRNRQRSAAITAAEDDAAPANKYSPNDEELSPPRPGRDLWGWSYDGTAETTDASAVTHRFLLTPPL